MTDNVPEITVILTMYNRPTSAIKQVECLVHQTVPPKEIWLWKNQSPTNSQNQLRHLVELSQRYPDVKIVDSNHNFKYHGRFALAQLARTEYVAIIDDDMFPDRKWFQNCIQSIEKVGGIMGGMGVILQQDRYRPNIKFGWQNHQSDHIQMVDICCQSWFFRKEWLHYLWMEEPLCWDNGEDIQFSYSAKKYGNISSYIPPHPISDTALWSSDITMGNQYSGDANATWRMGNHFQLRDEICSAYIKRGWKLVRHNPHHVHES